MVEGSKHVVALAHSGAHVHAGSGGGEGGMYAFALVLAQVMQANAITEACGIQSVNISLNQLSGIRTQVDGLNDSIEDATNATGFGGSTSSDPNGMLDGLTIATQNAELQYLTTEQNETNTKASTNASLLISNPMTADQVATGVGKFVDNALESMMNTSNRPTNYA